MKGSLALWCEQNGSIVDGHAPSLEVHLNIWQGSKKKKKLDVLDLGILIHDMRIFDTLKIYIPGKLEREAVSDLSGVLKDRKTLSAVFNDTLEVGKDRYYNDKKNYSFEAITNNTVSFHVIKIDIKADLSFEHIDDTDGQSGTIITFPKKYLEQFTEIGEHYFRLRFRLDGSNRDIFSDVVEPKDQIFHSTFAALDTVEFRLNEKRNFGDKLRAIFERGTIPDIRAVHYFLIRDINTELVRSHADYRKMRRLEPYLWDSYVSGIGDVFPNEMVIYHWRAGGTVPNSHVQDFIAYAAFRRPQLTGSLFVAAFIVILGALGSAIFDLSLSFIGSGTGLGSISLKLLIIFLFGLVAVLLFYYAPRFNPFKHK